MRNQNQRVSIETGIHSEIGPDQTIRNQGIQPKFLRRKAMIGILDKEAMREENNPMHFPGSMMKTNMGNMNPIQKMVIDNQRSPLKGKYLAIYQGIDPPAMETDTDLPAMETGSLDLEDLRAETIKEKGKDLETEKVVKVETPEGMIVRIGMEGSTIGIDPPTHHPLTKKNGEIEAVVSPEIDLTTTKTETTEEVTVPPHPDQTSEEVTALHLPAQTAAGAGKPPTLHLPIP